jgi:hypothetical protein
LPARTGAAGKYKVLLEPLYKQITTGIRGVDTKHTIILEGADWANDWSAFTAPFDKNLVYEFHYYCWDNPVVLNNIGKFLNYQTRFNAPIWAGETGERDNTVYWATTEYFEANNIGWCFWPWKKMDADNCPVSVRRPKQWNAVAAYSRGGPKPTSEVAQKALDELLTNIRLENCVFHSSVVNAMMRSVPGRIEAENFGHNGSGISYSVKNSARRSKYYRHDEPVTINAGESQRPRSNQYVTLEESEWTAYTIDSSARQNCEITVRARAVGSPAEAEVVIGGKSVPVKIGETTWSEIKLGSVQFNQGPNPLQWVVKQGTVDLDWIDVRVGP